VPFHFLGFEKFLGKVGHDLRIVALAAEHIQIGGVGLVGKMSGDQGGLDELSHGVSGHPFILAKMNHLGLPEAFHFDEVTQFSHEFPNGFCVTDDLRITVVQVNGTQNPPGWLLPGLASWAVLLHSGMTLLYVFFVIESASFYRDTPKSE
jgi:hypothetical protein